MQRILAGDERATPAADVLASLDVGYAAKAKAKAKAEREDGE